MRDPPRDAPARAGRGYAADGYARVSGRPGVVLATSGPGVINAATAAATAYADSVPLLGRAFGGHGVRVDDPAALASELRAALERPGPTVIEVPA